MSTGERNYCVLAAEVAERLFPIRRADRASECWSIGNDFYEVVGVMRPRIGIGRHRRLARGRKFFERHLCSRSRRCGAAKGT